MSLKRYVRCAVIVLFLSLKALGQQSDLKSEYDSIMQLDLLYYEKDDLLTYFFRRNEKTENQKELALCYHDYAIELYKTDLKKAIDYETKAIAIRERYKDDHDAMKKSLYSLGFFYIEDGDYFNAIKVYQKLVDIKEQDTRTYRAYTWLGVAYSEIGDFHKALSNYAKAQNYFEQRGEDENLFRNHINTCYAYALMGIVEHEKEIRDHIAKADSLRRRLTAQGVRISNQDLLAISQIKGNLFSDLKNDVEALKHHKKSLEIALKMKDFYEISRSYNNLGITASKLNNSKDAYVYYTNALAYAKDDPATQAIVFDNLGDYYRDKGKFEKALEYYQKAINYASGETGAVTFKMMLPMETLELSPYKLDLLTYLTDKAHAWIRYYENEKNNAYLNQALSTLKLADRLVDIIRFESTETQSKLFWRQKGADIYMNAVNVCYQLNLLEEAFYFMEKNKALLLLEDLTHENAKENAGLPDTLAAREFMLKRKILLEEQELINAAAGSKTKKDSLRDLVFNYKRTYEKFIDSLETQYPDYYNYRRKLAVIAYDSVLATQKENTLILHYILSETEGYGLLISGNDPCFFKIDSVPILHKNINRIRAMLTAPFNTKEELKSYQDLAFQLYNTLFPGIPQETLTGKRLCIIPDHDLQQFPFEVLMTSPDAPDAYLLNRCEISYAYSFSFLTLNQAVQRNPSNYFMGFAPVEFSPKVSLDSLPMSDEELTQIAGMFPGNLFLKQQASKQNFINNAFNYRVIHLATHADVGEDTYPWIAFRDDKLSLEELYATKNQAELVVLSACNTSQGELRTGEGLMSLARGFFSAGTQSVVATLWNADDRSTEAIMVDFYKQLKKGRTKSEALQYAKQQYLKERNGSALSPYYWSSIILIGDAGQLYAPVTGATNYYIIIGTGLLLLAGVWAVRRYLRS